MHVSDYKVFHQQNCRLCYTRQISNLRGFYSPKHSKEYSKLPKTHFIQLQFPSYDFTYWWYIRIISFSFLTKLEPWICPVKKILWRPSVLESIFGSFLFSQVSNIKVLRRVNQLRPHKFIFLGQFWRPTWLSVGTYSLYL